MPKGTCIVEECDHAVEVAKMCRAHYMRLRANMPLVPIQRRGKRGPCSEDGCEDRTVGHGYCQRHYYQFIAKPRFATAPACTFEGCDRPQRSKGLCAGHYKQQIAYVKRGPLREMTDPSARDDDGMKQCRGCREWFPEDGFFVNAARPDLLNAYCKRCDRDKGLRKRFGIGIEEYDALLEQQGGGCAICGRPPTDERSMAVDHDHACCPSKYKTCGKCIRGILCFPCNAGLGQFFDDQDLLLKAAAFLKARSSGGDPVSA